MSGSPVHGCMRKIRSKTEIRQIPFPLHQHTNKCLIILQMTFLVIFCWAFSLKETINNVNLRDQNNSFRSMIKNVMKNANNDLQGAYVVQRDIGGEKVIGLSHCVYNIHTKLLKNTF